MLNFDNSLPGLSHSEIAEFESRCDVKLPSEFVDLYLRHNGGRPELDRFTDENGTCIVNEFLPIKYGPSAFTLEATLQRIKRDRALLADHLVPFAVDPGGAYFCFSERLEDYGQIYFCMIESAQEGQAAVEFLAPSLNDFLSKLHPRR